MHSRFRARTIISVLVRYDCAMIRPDLTLIILRARIREVVILAE